MACFTTAVVFFILAQCATTYARGIHVSIYSPLNDPNTAMTFARTFVSNIAGCGEFGSQGTEDFNDIIQSMIQAQNTGKGRHDNNAKHKAMQMALASSIAELIVEESGGVNVQQKTNAAINALRSALMSTTGSVDEGFVSEIIDLVNHFSQEQFNEVDTGSSRQYYQSSTSGGQGGAPIVTETVTVNVGGSGGVPQSSGPGGVGPGGSVAYGPGGSGPYGLLGSGPGGAGPSGVVLGGSGPYGPGGNALNGPGGAGPVGVGMSGTPGSPNGPGGAYGPSGLGGAGQVGFENYGPGGPGGAGPGGLGGSGPGGPGGSGPGEEGPLTVDIDITLGGAPGGGPGGAGTGGVGPGAAVPGRPGGLAGTGGISGPMGVGPGGSGLYGPAGSGPYGPGGSGPGGVGPGGSGPYGPVGSEPYGMGGPGIAGPVGVGASGAPGGRGGPGGLGGPGGAYGLSGPGGAGAVGSVPYGPGVSVNYGPSGPVLSGLSGSGGPIGSGPLYEGSITMDIDITDGGVPVGGTFGVLPGGSGVELAGQTYGGSSRLPSLVNGILSSMGPSGFNYQNFANYMSQYSTGSGTCNSNDLNVLIDALMAALHCLSYGSGSVPSTPSYSAMSAYNQSIRRMFTF